MNAKLPKQTVADDTTTSIAQVNYTFETRDDTPEPPEPTEKFTVTYTSDGNGTVNESSRTFKQGAYITFPDTTPLEGFTFDKWVDSTTESEVTTQTVVESDMEVKATFKEDAKEVIEIELTTENKSLLGIDGTETELDFSQPIEGTDGKLYQVVAIGDNAFYDNTKLKQVNLDGVKTIGYAAFYNATGLNYLILPDSLTQIGAKAFYNSSTKGNNSIIDLSCNIEDKEVLDSIFNCADFETLIINDNVDYIGNNAFDNCSLKNIEFGTSDLTIGESAFRHISIEELSIPNNIIEIGEYAFADCSSLVHIDLSNMRAKPANGMFKGTTALRTIDFGNINLLPDGFLYQSGLEELTIPDSIKHIGIGALRECENLKTLTIEYGITSIDDMGIYRNTNLVNLTLPNSLKTIGDEAIAFNTSLIDVKIPSNVTSIGENAFKNVPHIYYNGSASGSPWGALAIN